MLIKNFRSFILNEKLHINVLTSELANSIFNELQEKNVNELEYINKEDKLNINKIKIKLLDDCPFMGELDISKSYKDKNDKWNIFINLRKIDYSLDTIEHELTHALQLTLLGKEKLISKINNIKSSYLFDPTTYKEIYSFFELLYLSNELEINAAISEANGLIKSYMLQFEKTNLTKNEFVYIIKGTRTYNISKLLINYKTSTHFANYNTNQINKFLCFIEDNTEELNKIQKSKLSTVKLFIKNIKDIFKFKLKSNSIESFFNINDDIKYKPKKNSKYYETYFNNQGEKLYKKLYSLYDHYKN